MSVHDKSEPTMVTFLSKIIIHETNEDSKPVEPPSYSHCVDIPASDDQSLTSSLSFRDISYTLRNTSIDQWRRERYPSFLKPKPPKRILHKVSGHFTTGMNAIMGPTGCGKSSLLDALAGRKDPRGLEGDIFLNGLSIPSTFKHEIGYVVQDDVISGTLTVRENLMFSVNVRLPSCASQNEREQCVTNVIHTLGLTTCADTRVGTEFLRGISGGERKRTCIGMELVLKPKILFLDEPTTGLDASTARSVMQCLNELSKQGRTIIFSIHQPRYSIFKLFDTVLLMCQGESVYHDSAENVLSYFNEQGYRCELHDNPADFVLDILIDAAQNSEKLNKLTDAFNKSAMHTKAIGDINQQIKNVREQAVVIGDRSLGRELYHIAIRTLKNAVRNPALFMAQVIVAIILGILVGLVFYDMGLTDDPGISNRFGAIFFIVVSQIFGSVTALEPLLKERALFIHENVSGYYQIWTYFLTKLLCDLLPMRAIPAFVFSLCTYFMTGLQRSVTQFFVFLLTIFMATLFGSALCFFISATIPVFAVALLVVVLIFAVMMIFSGFIVELSSIFKWLSWIQWISAFRYSSNLLAINEFRHITFCSKNTTFGCLVTGADVLTIKQLDYQTDWDMWKNFFALAMMSGGFLLLALIQLIRMKKTK